VFFSQLGGVIADSRFILDAFRYTELFLILLFIIGWSVFNLVSVSWLLVFLNVAVAIGISVIAPITKSLTPDVVSSQDELVLTNSWLLTTEKFVRYAAPAFAGYSAAYARFSNILIWCLSCLALVVLVKQLVRFSRESKYSKLQTDPEEIKSPEKPPGETSVSSEVSIGVLESLWQGASIVSRKELRPYLMNTITTNLIIYPFYSVFVPVACRSMNPSGWRADIATINLGGMVGPVISQAFMQSKFRPGNVKLGMTLAMTAQAIILLIQVGALLFCYGGEDLGQIQASSTKVSKLTSAETLEIMRLGKAYIIANSTFSWWGAMLSKSENPLVICPDIWFKSQAEPLDLIPSSWKRVPAWQ
jgi:hypothetical protein